MRNNALYFPYIDVPNDAWTVKALLYWDKLSSIVPMGHMETPDDMSDFMRELMTEGLVEPVFPGQFIHQIERFDESCPTQDSAFKQMMHLFRVARIKWRKSKRLCAPVGRKSHMARSRR